MSAETNKTVIRHWVEQAWNGGNLALADDLYAPTYAFHDPTTPPLPPGPEGIKALLTTYRTAFPDLVMTVEDMVAEGDRVAWRWVVRGTHLGPLMGIPPSGKPIHVTGLVVTRFAEGKWQEDWSTFDLLGLLQQIGAIPTLGATAA